MASSAAGNELTESLAISLRSRTAPRSFPSRAPWDTFWKEDEDVLGKSLQKMTSRVRTPPERTIYNFHCQPYGSGLDEAPELTEDLCPEDAGHSIGPVSSKGLREAIEEGQLLGAVVNPNGEN